MEVTSPVLFRADGGAGIGSGHLTRCLGLAQQLADGGWPCHLLTSRPDLPAVGRWRAEGVPVTPLRAVAGTVEDAMEAIELARALDAAWVVSDGYHLGPEFQARVKAAGLAILSFHDLADQPMVADIVVNQTPGAETRCAYNCPPGSRTLLGAEYAVMRREIRLCSATGGDGLLITFGEADSDNLGLAALREISHLPDDFSVTLVCSAGPKGLAAARAVASLCGRPIVVKPPGEIVPLMAGADTALCAGGTTSLELAFLGVPLVLLTISANQEPGARALAESGAALRVETLQEAARLVSEVMADGRRRAVMAAAARRLVDGRGAERVVAAMRARLTGKEAQA